MSSQPPDQESPKPDVFDPGNFVQSDLNHVYAIFFNEGGIVLQTRIDSDPSTVSYSIPHTGHPIENSQRISPVGTITVGTFNNALSLLQNNLEDVLEYYDEEDEFLKLRQAFVYNLINYIVFYSLQLLLQNEILNVPKDLVAKLKGLTQQYKGKVTAYLEHRQTEDPQAFKFIVDQISAILGKTFTQDMLPHAQEP